MKLFRISNVLLLCVAAGFGTLLFSTSQSVQQAEDRLADISLNLRQEKESIRVLDAEWDYLNRPQRLEELAGKYLKVEAPVSDQFMESAESIPDEEVVTPAVVTTPAVPAAPVPQPAIYAQPVAAVPAQPAPSKNVPSEYIKASEKQSFETLIKNLEAGQ